MKRVVNSVLAEFGEDFDTGGRRVIEVAQSHLWFKKMPFKINSSSEVEFIDPAEDPEGWALCVPYLRDVQNSLTEFDKVVEAITSFYLDWTPENPNYDWQFHDLLRLGAHAGEPILDGKERCGVKVKAYCCNITPDTSIPANSQLSQLLRASQIGAENLNANGTVIAINKLVRRLTEGERVATISVDIESRHVGWDGNNVLAIGIGVSSTECELFYFANTVVAPVIRAAFGRLFNHPCIRIIGHNFLFDASRLRYAWGLDSVPVSEDTLLQHYIFWNEKRGTQSLKLVAPLLLGAPRWDDELDTIKLKLGREEKVLKDDFTYDLIPADILLPYLAMDVIATYRLHELTTRGRELIAGWSSKFVLYDQAIKLSNALADVQLAGLQIDIDHLGDLEYELDERYAVATEKLREMEAVYWDPARFAIATGHKSMLALLQKDPEKLARTPFNPKAHAQFKWLLQEVFGARGGELFPDTRAETIEEVLTRVEDGDVILENASATDFVAALGEVRKVEKIQGTVVQGFRHEICQDLKVRSSYAIHGTETGRLASSSPNVQNLSREKSVKNLIVATPGYKLVNMDYSQVELRVLAWVSGDTGMIDDFNSGEDFHDRTATGIWGPNFTKEQRVGAKTVSFGV